MNDNVNISGLTRAQVLAALYNFSRQQGMGFMYTRGQHGLSVEEAEELLKQTDYFDYLYGRVMKIELREGADSFDPRLYDRDVGQGAAQRTINNLREELGC